MNKQSRFFNLNTLIIIMGLLSIILVGIEVLNMQIEASINWENNCFCCDIHESTKSCTDVVYEPEYKRCRNTIFPHIPFLINSSDEFYEPINTSSCDIILES